MYSRSRAFRRSDIHSNFKDLATTGRFNALVVNCRVDCPKNRKQYNATSTQD